MKIMTFNTQHCLNYKEQKIDFEIMADTIKKFDPDICGLNEMRGKGADEDYTNQTKTLADLCGYKYFYFAKALDVGGKNPYGNAILSKYPIENVEVIKIPSEYETRCLLIADLSCGLRVLITHFGLVEEEKRNAVKTACENLSGENCVLMGDFNVTPESEIINPIREKMKDAADYIKGDLLTFPSDKPEIKIDYIFTSRDIEILSAEIPNIIASDHRPHIVEIK